MLPEPFALNTWIGNHRAQYFRIFVSGTDTHKVMKVLLINTYSGGGGAAVAARRLLEALDAIGVEVRLLVATDGEQADDDIVAPYHTGTWGKWRWKADFVKERLTLLPHVGYERARLFRYSPDGGGDVSNHPWVAWADVIHLHWVQHAFVSLRGVEALIATGKPLLWSLHDLWPITGGCHIPYFFEKEKVERCVKFHHHCEACPILLGGRPQDLSWRQYQRKSKLPYDKVRFLAVSHAVADEVRVSALSRRSIVSVLPNMVDPGIFRPLSERCTEDFRMLFVAARPDDPIKGLELCKEALHKACECSESFARNAVFVCVGVPKDHRVLEDFPVTVEAMGAVHSVEILVRLYNSARVTLSTSLFETFGQTLLESVACGTPALAFGVGGISDIIVEENGRLIPPYDTSAMARALLHLFEHPEEWAQKERVSATASRFYAETVAEQARTIYASMLSE